MTVLPTAMDLDAFADHTSGRILDRLQAFQIIWTALTVSAQLIRRTCLYLPPLFLVDCFIDVPGH